MPFTQLRALTRRGPTLLRGAVAAAVAAALAGCAGGAGADSTTSAERYIQGDGSTASFAPEERQPAPQISGETLEGDALRLADYEGSVVVVNFWASWCAPCRAETPVLQEVHAEHEAAGLEFLGINIKDDRTAAKAFDREREVDYPSLYDQPGTIAQAFRDTVPPKAIPSTIVIDRQGRIAARAIGPVNYNDLTGLVEPVLQEGESQGAGSS
ncbi:TlpA family protein disulfide reductase [Salinactinospora qingdaonensis]|uniref:Thioredoxin domain-containing protein n=1 Tax=Salinactinospora qingdaonensis TaxID=702744 RepID=A0ABP7FZC5_9ACTN